VDRIARIALTSFRRNRKLGECDPRSVFAAVIMAAQLGWEIDLGGQAYLVPYKRECQLVPGWQGLVDLVFRAGKAAVWTGAVYEGDEFDYSLGDLPFLRHRPAGNPHAKLEATYAIGRVHNSTWPVIEVWSVEKLLEHRDRYNRVGKAHYSFEHFEMYGRKVALLQVLKYLPKSAEVQTAIQLDNAASTGSQNLTYAEAIDGTWVPEPPPDPEPAPVRSASQEVKEQLKQRRQEAPLSEEQVQDIWPPKKESDG
jgi:recombination protein RecT